MDERNNRYGQRDYYRPQAPDYGADYGSGREFTYSSARDYAAAGELGNDRQGLGARGWREDNWAERGEGRGRAGYGRGDYGPRGYQGGRGHVRAEYGAGARGFGRSYRDDYGYDRDRGFLERAGDEVRSWFGDEEAEHRREQDQRYDERLARFERWRDSNGGDTHYNAWRRDRIAELDNDYDEYRRENAKRFSDEFTTWRTDRQGQRDQLRLVTEHMEVIGSDGSPVGTVDKVRGDRIILAKGDANAGGHHHSIPSRWIHNVDDKVTLRKTAEEAIAHWHDEERLGALFGEGQDWRTERNLNRSFSGTY